MMVSLVVYAVWTVVNIYLYTNIHEDNSTVESLSESQRSHTIWGD